ncbi:MAG: site-specific integrase [Ignavibacteriales bacterium]|nr:site-specific integrase [Ignavibacteriales bacterium]
MDIFIREYLATLKLERNLSDNTIASYKNDLSSLLNFLKDSGVEDPSQINSKLLNDFFGLLTKLGLSSRSSARYYSSCKRIFWLPVFQRIH